MSPLWGLLEIEKKKTPWGGVVRGLWERGGGAGAKNEKAWKGQRLRVSRGEGHSSLSRSVLGKTVDYRLCSVRQKNCLWHWLCPCQKQQQQKTVKQGWLLAGSKTRSEHMKGPSESLFNTTIHSMWIFAISPAFPRDLRQNNPREMVKNKNIDWLILFRLWCVGV